MDDCVLAVCELSNDLLYHKIPKDKLAYYVDGSLKAGIDAARQYADVDLEGMYRQDGISVEYKEDGKGAFGMAYRGQITLSKDGCSLEIFRSSIRELAENSKNGAFPPLTYEQARDIHLAHEFFHYLEYRGNCFVSEALEPVTTMQVFGLKRRARINRCSEVSAHAFAKALLRLPVLPNYYDYIYLINTKKMTPEAFEAMQSKYENELNGA